MSQSIPVLIGSLWNNMGKTRRRHFIWLTLLMILSLMTEVVSVGSVLPLIAAMTNPESLFNNAIINKYINISGLSTTKEAQTALVGIFIFAVVLASVTRLSLLWFTGKVAFSAGAEIALRMFRTILNQPLPIHTARNSSELISSIASKSEEIVSYVLIPVVTIASNSLIIVGVVGTLFLINKVVAFTLLVGFGSVYVLVLISTKKMLAKNSKTIAYQSANLIKILNEGLGGIRDVLLEGSQDVYCINFERSDSTLRDAQRINHFLSQGPRFIIEGGAMVLIAVVSYYLLIDKPGYGNSIAVIATFAVGAQRMLPLMQHTYWAVSGIRGSQSLLQDILLILDQENSYSSNVIRHERTQFEKEITLEEVFFRYPQGYSDVIKSATLSIKKGQSIGIIGKTGSGKSTLLDLIMGLIMPTSGRIAIDGLIVTEQNVKAWQSNIAHVPQAIFLSDATITENIALGVVPELIDHNRVLTCAKQAKVDEFVRFLPDKYDTVVGERGARISGGERQRIGIARALYRKCSVLILDEATSALDESTEIDIIKVVEDLPADITIIFVSHRPAALAFCSAIYVIEHGVVRLVKGM